jgi:hypothetical protein
VDNDPEGSFYNLKNQYEKYYFKTPLIINKFFPNGFSDYYIENSNIIKNDISDFIKEVRSPINEVFTSFIFNNLDIDYTEECINELSEKIENNAIITITQYYGSKLKKLLKILESNNFIQRKLLEQKNIPLDDSLCYPLKVAMNSIDSGDGNINMQRIIYKKGNQINLYFFK